MRISDWSSDVCSSDLAAYRQPLGDGMDVGQHVRFVRQLDQRVAVVARHRHHAARPVMLERAGQQPDVVRGERAGDGVAREPLVVLAFEGEANRPVAVDQAAMGRRSEEHTSELQSLMRISYSVFCLQKKTTKTT